MPFWAQYRIPVTATHFTGAILSAGKARVAPWNMYHKRRATQLAGKTARPFGWVIAVHRVLAFDFETIWFVYYRSISLVRPL